MRFQATATKPRVALDAAAGVGIEASLLRDRLDGWCKHYDITASTKTKSVAQEFEELVGRWHQSCGPTSSMTRMILDDAYQRIIGLGPAAIPLLLRELVERPDHWDWALRAITGARVTDASDEGDLDGIASKWLRWGKERGYLA